jgi:hypothetical protein
MGFLRWYFLSKTFCCCLPVRAGVIVMSFLSILVAGILSLLIWYEVASAAEISAHTRSGFVGAGVVETLYCLASIIGFMGAVARKQLFVVIYAYFIYLHFLLHVGIAIWLIWLIAHTTNTDVVKGCQLGIANEEAKSQCSSLLHVTQGVFIGIALFVLLIEAYCALIVYRYGYQLKNQKRAARVSRESDWGLLSHKGESSLMENGVKKYPSASEFDPYHELEVRDAPLPSYPYGPDPDQEQGYGGGSWTHSAIADDEKRRLRDTETPSSPSTHSLATPRAHATYADLVTEDPHSVHELPMSADAETLPGYDYAKDGRNLPVDRKA